MTAAATGGWSRTSVCPPMPLHPSVDACMFGLPPSPRRVPFCLCIILTAMPAGLSAAERALDFEEEHYSPDEHSSGLPVQRLGDGLQEANARDRGKRLVSQASHGISATECPHIYDRFAK